MTNIFRRLFSSLPLTTVIVPVLLIISSCGYEGEGFNTQPNTPFEMAVTEVQLDISSKAPIASAGPDAAYYDQSAVNTATSITLDGSGSYDPNQDEISYLWTQVDNEGEGAIALPQSDPLYVQLSSAAAQKPAFNAPNVVITKYLYFKLTVTDENALDSEPDYVKITINNKYNDQPIAQAGDDLSRGENQVVQLTGQGNDPNQDQITFKWKQIWGPEVKNLTGENSAQLDFVTPQVYKDEVVIFKLTVTDDKGGKGEDQITISIANDINEAPTLVVEVRIEDKSVQVENGTINILEGEKLEVAISKSYDPNQDEIEFTADFDTPPIPTGFGASFNQNTAIFSLTAEYGKNGSQSDGPFTLKLKVEDSGNLSEQRTLTIKITNVNRQPQLEPLTNRSINEGEKLIVTLDGSDIDQDQITYRATNLPLGSQLEGNIFSFTPNFGPNGRSADGPFEVIFSVEDNGQPPLKVVQKLQIQVNNINQAPFFKPVAKQVVQENSQLVIILQTSDPDSDIMVLQEEKLPPDSSFNPSNGKLTITPGYESTGKYPAIFKVIDNGLPPLAGRLEFQVEITNTNRAPVLTVPGPQTVKENQENSFTVSGSDLDGNQVSIKAENMPTGAQFDLDTNSGIYTFKWRPDFSQAKHGQPGLIKVVFKATDDGIPSLEVLKTVDITVKNVNRPPKIELLEQFSFNEQQQVVLSGDLSKDPDGQTLTFVWSRTDKNPLPVVMAGQNSAHLQLKLPVVYTPEELAFTLEIFDEEGAKDQKSVKLLVNDNINEMPVADFMVKFPSMAMAVLNEIQLDGTKSYDPNEEKLTYIWRVDGKIKGIILANPFFKCSLLKGRSLISLEVVDERNGRHSSSKIIEINNSPPKAIAGNDQLVVATGMETEISLNGSGSTDVDGDKLNYFWLKGGSLLAQGQTAKTKLAPGNHLLTLKVTDGQLSDQDQLKVEILVEAPQVTILSPQNEKTLDPGIIAIKAEVNSKFDQPVKVTWEQISGPETGIFIDKHQTETSFIARTEGKYILQIKAESMGKTGKEEMEITIKDIPPQAKIDGPKQGVPGFALRISGHGSYDLNGPLSAYNWQLVQGPTGNSALGELSRKRQLTFTPDQEGEYLFELKVTDKSGSTSQAATHNLKIIDPKTGDHPPQIVFYTQDLQEKGEIILHAGDSYDPDGDKLTSHWQQTDGPQLNLSAAGLLQFLSPPEAGENGAKIDGNMPKILAVDANQEGKYSFKLTISDQQNSFQAETSVQVFDPAKGRPPVPDVVSRVKGHLFETIHLDASSSADLDQDNLSYLWRQLEGQTVDIQGKNNAKASFFASTPGKLVFKVDVSDTKFTRTSKEVTVLIANQGDQLPKAGIKVDKTFFNLGDTVTLDGSDSYDPEKEKLTYHWRQLRGPKVLAHNFQDAKISFQPLYAGQYIYALMVNNGKNSSFEDYLFFEVGQLQTDRSGTESLDYGAYPPSLETIEEGGCNCSVVK